MVNLALSGCMGICQNPLAAPGFKKCWVPANFKATSSNTNLVRFTALFSFLRSTQILSFPLLFCTGTIGAHHFVGLVTLSMMSASSICLSSSFTFGMRGKVILLAALTHLGSAFSSNWIFTGSYLNRPISPNNSAFTFSNLATRPISKAARRSRKLLAWSLLITKISTLYFLLQCVTAVLNCPTHCHLPPGLKRSLLDGWNMGWFRKLSKADFEMAVISAPVSILNTTGLPLTCAEPSIHHPDPNHLMIHLRTNDQHCRHL